MPVRARTSRKILVASMGVATMTYIVACGGNTESTGDGGPAGDGPLDHATIDEFPAGNLVARPDTGAPDDAASDGPTDGPGDVEVMDVNAKDMSVPDTIDEFPIGNLVARPDSGKKK